MLSRALKVIREYHELRQSHLARELGLSPSYLSEIESGAKIPSVEVLEKYSEHFDIPLSSIMFFADLVDEGVEPDQLRKKIASNALKFLSFLNDQKLNHA